MVVLYDSAPPTCQDWGPIFLADNMIVTAAPVQLLGDLNCDGLVTFSDINPFVLALSDPASYAAQYPNCNLLNGDCNSDGVVTFDDINAFVALLSGG